jgi:hypothetical protein
VCTLVVRVPAARSEVPLLLLGVRDELIDRPWLPPARHWPGLPVIGGQDLQAGGTWLAVHTEIPRAACVLNGRGTPAPSVGRRSRGDVPLRAVTRGADELARRLRGSETVARYDPFYLVYGEPSCAELVSWDGTAVRTESLAPGTHLLTNDGRTYFQAADGAIPAEVAASSARAGYFGPRFAAPSPELGARCPADAVWQAWRGLAAGDGLPADDPRALIVRRELAGGRRWGTSSVSLVAVGRSGVRYDFQGTPGDQAAWRTVSGAPAGLRTAL